MIDLTGINAEEAAKIKKQLINKKRELQKNIPELLQSPLKHELEIQESFKNLNEIEKLLIEVNKIGSGAGDGQVNKAYQRIETIQRLNQKYFPIVVNETLEQKIIRERIEFTVITVKIPRVLKSQLDNIKKILMIPNNGIFFIYIIETFLETLGDLENNFFVSQDIKQIDGD